MKLKVLVTAVFTIFAGQIALAHDIKPNGSVSVENEFVSAESEQITVRITGEAAEVLCSAIGIQLDQQPNNYIGSKGSYTCGKTKNGQSYAGHVVNPDGSTVDLESADYQ